MLLNVLKDVSGLVFTFSIKVPVEVLVKEQDGSDFKEEAEQVSVFLEVEN